MCWSGSSAEWNRRSQIANRPNALFSICDWLFTNMESEHLSSRLQQYLLKQIPISKGLGISIPEASLEEIRITAPLAPNLNHHGTAFGGSVSAVAILAGWTLVYARLEAEGQFPAVVIQHNEIRYVTPIEGAFSARARLARPEQWSHFLQGLARHRKARTIVAVEVEGTRGLSALFRGTYVALQATPSANVNEHQRTSAPTAEQPVTS
jgi:thioesterase domain-containing protein